jgi:choice-of-anchor B domain-containing protein
VHIVYDSDSLFSRTHTIFIDTVSARLYACATHSNALSIYSIQNPVQPVLLSHYNGVTFVHDMYARNDTAYLNCGSSGIYIVDFQNPASPVNLGSLTLYPNQGLNHSGWLNSTGDVYVFTDENYGRKVKVCDVSNFSNIQIQSTLTSGVSDSSVAHNAFIKGDHVYIAYYNDGLQIFDISDPLAPFKSGCYDTFLPIQEDDFRGAWGVYPFLPSGNVLVSDRNSGLYVLDASAAITGVEDHPADVAIITLYPNPVSNNLSIVIENKASREISIELYNAYGVIVREYESVKVTNGKAQITSNISDLSSGLYFIKINNNLFRRFVKL